MKEGALNPQTLLGLNSNATPLSKLIWNVF